MRLFGSKEVPADGVTLATWQDEYSILNSKHFIGIHGYIIVYSVGSKQSFEMVRIIRDKILNHLVSDSPRLFIATGLSCSMTGCRLGSDRHCGKQERSTA
jgi:predicted Abi (CAAX) family protease